MFPIVCVRRFGAQRQDKTTNSMDDDSKKEDDARSVTHLRAQQDASSSSRSDDIPGTSPVHRYDTSTEKEASDGAGKISVHTSSSSPLSKSGNPSSAHAKLSRDSDITTPRSALTQPPEMREAIFAHRTSDTGDDVRARMHSTFESPLSHSDLSS